MIREETLPETTPCEENKCLVYPSCKYKIRVECTVLRNFYLRIHDIILTTEYGTKLQTDKRTWAEMHRFFPNLNAIFEDKNEGYHI